MVVEKVAPEDFRKDVMMATPSAGQTVALLVPSSGSSMAVEMALPTVVRSEFLSDGHWASNLDIRMAATMDNPSVDVWVALTVGLSAGMSAAYSDNGLASTGAER